MKEREQKDVTMIFCVGVPASGMFWEFHPELTGDWDKDKEVILNS